MFKKFNYFIKKSIYFNYNNFKNFTKKTKDNIIFQIIFQKFYTTI